VPIDWPGNGLAVRHNFLWAMSTTLVSNTHARPGRFASSCR
jgi:hypothetical protein